jgi:hypothetical protein
MAPDERHASRRRPRGIIPVMPRIIEGFIVAGFPFSPVIL